MTEATLDEELRQAREKVRHAKDAAMQREEDYRLEVARLEAESAERLRLIEAAAEENERLRGVIEGARMAMTQAARAEVEAARKETRDALHMEQVAVAAAARANAKRQDIEAKLARIVDLIEQARPMVDDGTASRLLRQATQEAGQP